MALVKGIYDLQSQRLYIITLSMGFSSPRSICHHGLASSVVDEQHLDQKALFVQLSMAFSAEKESSRYTLDCVTVLSKARLASEIQCYKDKK